MKQLCKKMAGAAAILFILAACSENNSNYPEEYVGFDKTTKNYSFDRSKDVEEFDIKIIAAEKKKEDREVLINGVSMPGQTVVFSIEDKKGYYSCKKEICQSAREDLSQENKKQDRVSYRLYPAGQGSEKNTNHGIPATQIT